MIKQTRNDMAGALNSIAPGATWVYFDEDYNTLEWYSKDIPKPSKEAIEKEMARLTSLIEEQKQLEIQQEEELQAAKESAIQKLSILGLTQEEAKAIVGL